MASAEPKISEDPPRYRKYTNGHSYSRRTSIHQHTCKHCGKAFLGSFDKYNCSDECRAHTMLKNELARKRQSKVVEPSQGAEIPGKTAPNG